MIFKISKQQLNVSNEQLNAKKIKIWLEIFFLSRNKFYTNQICVLTGFMKLGPESPFQISLPAITASNEYESSMPLFPAGLILHGGDYMDYLRAPWSMPWCPWNALVPSSGNLPYRVAFTEEIMPWCPCHSKNWAYRACLWFLYFVLKQNIYFLLISLAANKQNACPKEDSPYGSCEKSCSGDSDCDGALKCCSHGPEGCGTQCKETVKGGSHFDNWTVTKFILKGTVTPLLIVKDQSSQLVCPNIYA